MQNSDIENLSNTYLQMINEAVDDLDTVIRDDGYKVEYYVDDYSEDETVYYIYVTAPNEEKPYLIQGNDPEPYVKYHKEHGTFPSK